MTQICNLLFAINLLFVASISWLQRKNSFEKQNLLYRDRRGTLPTTTGTSVVAVVAAEVGAV